MSCPSFTTTIVGNAVAIFSTSGEMKSDRVIGWAVVLGVFVEDIDVVLKETRRGDGPRCISALGVLRRRCLMGDKSQDGFVISNTASHLTFHRPGEILFKFHSGR